jgi:PAS domain S-box-containing protein
MNEFLRVLMVEDNMDDVVLMLHALRQIGSTVIHAVVDSPAAMRAALQEDQEWDIILSDHALPHFNAPQALALAKDLCPKTPFIIVSGEIDLTQAVELMRQGAQDYIPKRDLARLAPAVERGLREVALRRERNRVQDALHESEARLRTVVSEVPVILFTLDSQGMITFADGKSLTALGFSPQQVIGRQVYDFIPQNSKIKTDILRVLAGSEVSFTSNFADLWFDGRLTPLRSSENEIIGITGIMTDITGRKRMEDALEQRLIALTQPLDQPAGINFLDLFKLEDIQQIQDAFADATRVASIIITPDGNPITQPSRYCRLCLEVIHNTEKGRVNCAMSNTAFRWENHDPNIQPCLSAGLWDSGASITVGGKEIAKWLIGQVRDEQMDEASMLKYADEIGVDRAAYKQALAEVPVMSREQFEKVANALVLFANQLSIKAYQNVQQARFIAAREKAEASMRLSQVQIELQLERVNLLHQIDLVITSQGDLQDKVTRILKHITRVSVFNVVALWLPLETSHSLVLGAQVGLLDPSLDSGNMTFEPDDCVRQAYTERQVSYCPDLYETLSTRAAAWHEKFASCVSVPLLVGDQVKGVLQFFNSQQVDLDADWQGFLQTLAMQMALTLEQADLLDQMEFAHLELQQAYDATLEGWSQALELRERETAGHSRRVVEQTLAMGRAFGLNEEDLRHMWHGALLHDIGKMGIPDHVLLKPGPLNDEEWRLMRQHPIYAYRLLAGISHLEPALDIPYCHHEKWDGSGYPRGLQGEQIPLVARLFAIVDVCDALLSDRPYRAALPAQEVKRYLREQSGLHFDPHVVDVFLDMWNETHDDKGNQSEPA